MKKIIFLLLILFLFVSCSNQITQTSTMLSQEEVNALNLALEDEYKAEATYQKVLDDFGEVNPFSNIIRAEQKHSSKLIQLYELYGLEVPQNLWYQEVISFNSIQEACEGGVQAEIENIQLYNNILESTQKEDILQVYYSLQKASQEKHLPAFERCS
jgi:hypothetical protein